MNLSVENCALVLVDMQRGYTDPENVRGQWMRRNHPLSHRYFFDRIGRIVPNLRDVLGAFRSRGLSIVHVTFGSERADRSDMLLAAHRIGPPWARQESDLAPFMLGGPEHGIIGELEPASGEPVFNKRSHSAFTTTSIENELTRAKVARLVIGGWATNACVELTARDAADRGFETFLIEDACAAFTPSTHEAALRNFSRLYGGVVSTREVLDIASLDC